jgi:multicomponent K+:H+ antiporter subunit G
MIASLLDLLAGAFLIFGGGFALIGSVGLARLPDIFTRLHGPTKATTLGVGGILLGSIVYFSTRQALSLHELLVTIFLFMTAPVSAHLLARAALHRHCHSKAPVSETGADAAAGAGLGEKPVGREAGPVDRL